MFTIETHRRPGPGRFPDAVDALVAFSFGFATWYFLARFLDQVESQHEMVNAMIDSVGSVNMGALAMGLLAGLTSYGLRRR